MIALSVPDMFTPLLPFILLVVIIFTARTPWFKGIAGEMIVNAASWIFLNKKEYRIVKNVTLLLEDGDTTQIDHIIVSKYGIFVVETKNMKGWIFGGEHQKKWTQKIFKQTYTFQNPLHQNYKHTKAVQEMLNLTDREVFSLVVFVGESTFKTDMPPNVTHGISYIWYVKSKKTPLFSSHEVDTFSAKIYEGRLSPNRQTKKRHVENLKTPKRKPYQLSAPLCPRCSSRMVKRTATKGKYRGKDFWGCSRYPYCKGIVDISS